MPDTEMIVMIAVFAAVTLSFISLIRLVGTWIVHSTIRRAVEKNPDAVHPFLAQLGAPRQSDGDDRLSVVLVAVGIAMIAASVVINDAGWMHYAIAGALFPLIIGTALWLRLFILERARRRAQQQ